MLHFLRIQAAAAPLLLAVVAYCIIGFIGTFNPLNPETQTTWRMIYGTVGISAILLAIWLRLLSQRGNIAVSLSKSIKELTGLGIQMLFGCIVEVLITVVLLVAVLVALNWLGWNT